MTTTETPRIWVGCLACYNDGRLVGHWTDAVDYDEGDYRATLPERCAGFASVPHEELWVMDHEGFAGFLSGECSPTHAQEIAEAMDKIADEGYPVAAVAAWHQYSPTYNDITDLDSFADAYCGEWGSGAEYAEELTRDCAPSREALELLDSWLGGHVDWDAIWHDMDCSGYWTADAGGGNVYIFSPS